MQITSTKVVYLDQNAIIWLADKRLPKGTHNVSIEELECCLVEAVNRKACVFPFGPVHLEETRDASPNSKEKICRVFDLLSGRYRFFDKSVILGRQAVDIFIGRQLAFSRMEAVGKCDYDFRIFLPDKPSKAALNKAFVGVTGGWASMTRQEIEGQVEREEAATYAKLIQRLMDRFVSGLPPELSEIMGLPNSIFADLCEAAETAGYPNPQSAAIGFMNDRILEVPGIRIESNMLAKEAALYAKDNAHPRSISKPFANYSRDIEAASTYLPYCDAALIERGRVETIRQCKDLFPRRLALFTIKSLDGFCEWVRNLETPVYTPPLLSDWLANIQTLGTPRIGLGLHPSKPDFFIGSTHDHVLPNNVIVRELGGGGRSLATRLDSTEHSVVEQSLRNLLELADRNWVRITGDANIEVILCSEGSMCGPVLARMPFGYFNLLNPPTSQLARNLISR